MITASRDRPNVTPFPFSLASLAFIRPSSAAPWALSGIASVSRNVGNAPSKPSRVCATGINPSTAS